MQQFTRTKIIATLGPASTDVETISHLIKAGVDVFRLNFSHGNHESHTIAINTIHEVNKKLATNVSILADLQGPKIRLGEVENNGVTIEAGDEITFTTRKTVGNKKWLYVGYPQFAQDVSAQERILIDDGKIELKVISTNGMDEVKAEVIYGGVVRSKKGINLPDTDISTASLTTKDKADLEFILTQNVNWVALSFVRFSDEILKLKGMIQYKDHPAKVIAKIEKPEAINNIDEIIRVTDAIMVARGDLGVEMPLETIPIIQKEIVQKCLKASKPVIIATQMMESMMENPSPTRAEITDVANAIYDGADALMLSGETAVGKHPVKVIETFTKVIQSIETQETIFDKYHDPEEGTESFLADSICLNACKIASQVGATALIAMTKSGYTAFTLSSHRPKAYIYVFTESEELLNTVSLIWGVRAFHYNKFVSTDQTISDVQTILKRHRLIKQGDIVVNTGSMPLNQRGKTNMVKITKIR